MSKRLVSLEETADDPRSIKVDLAVKPTYHNGVRFEENIQPGIEITDPGDYEEIEGYE